MWGGSVEMWTDLFGVRDPRWLREGREKPGATVLKWISGRKGAATRVTAPRFVAHQSPSVSMAVCSSRERSPSSSSSSGCVLMIGMGRLLFVLLPLLGTGGVASTPVGIGNGEDLLLDGLLPLLACFVASDEC